jgi:CBS domain-containing membrane protein
MSKDLITLDENDDIHQALDKFKYNNLMSLPVIQKDNHIVGTLALYDVVEWFKRAADPRASWSIWSNKL